MKDACRNCDCHPCRCTSAYQAVRDAVKLMPHGSEKRNLQRVAALLNWKKRPFSSVAEAGAVVIRIPRRKKAAR